MTVDELRAASEGLYEGVDGTFRRVTTGAQSVRGIVCDYGKAYYYVEEFAAWALRRVPVEGTGPTALDLVLGDRLVDEFGAGLTGEAARLAAGYVWLAEGLSRLMGGPEAMDELLRARDAIGRERYGHPLRVDTLHADGTPYNWLNEAGEELADALLYFRAAVEEAANR